MLIWQNCSGVERVTDLKFQVLFTKDEAQTPLSFCFHDYCTLFCFYSPPPLFILLIFSFHVITFTFHHLCQHCHLSMAFQSSSLRRFYHNSSSGSSLLLLYSFIFLFLFLLFLVLRQIVYCLCKDNLFSVKVWVRVGAGV